MPLKYQFLITLDVEWPQAGLGAGMADLAHQPRSCVYLSVSHSILSTGSYSTHHIGLTSCIQEHRKGALDRASITMKKIITYPWNFIFNHEVSPLRHIKDPAMRHYILQLLGGMWAVSFCTAIGSYTLLAASVIGHAVLIGAASITVAAWSAATLKPSLFKSGFGRSSDGEHN